MTRRRLTERQVIFVLIEQGVTIPCHQCRVAFRDGDEIEREHLHALALGGTDTLDNMRFSHKDCHKTETNGTKATTAGSTKHVVAKVKRIAKKNEGRAAPNSLRVTPSTEPPRAREGGSPKRKIQNRGFPESPPRYKNQWPSRKVGA